MSRKKETAWHHPSPERLREFESGTLLDERAIEIETHLAGCAVCCEALTQLPNDGFVTRLREAYQTAQPRPTPGSSSTPPPPRTIAFSTLPTNETPIPDEAPTLPGFDDVRELGRGGMGVVYAATHALMGRRVAVKVIHPELASHPAAAERFRREAHAAARLSHPNIVTAHDAGESGERLFLVMEYIDGESLADRLRQLGSLPVAEACDVVRQAALGVQHAHDNGLVHRDLKPHNLMRTADGTIKVCDFGLAALADDRGRGTGTTAPNAVMGTPDYMAPEQAEDARRADGRADVYSLGCTLYHLLTGEVPFPEESTLVTLLAHRTCDRPSARRLRPEVAPRLDAVLRKAMARLPEDRYQTPGALAEALTACAGAANSSRTARRRTLTALAAIALLSVIGAAGVIRLPVSKDREIIIETDDPSIEVVVKGDRIVRIVDPKSGKTYRLDREDLTLSLIDDPNGLAVALDGNSPVVLKRRGKRIAILRLEPRKPVLAEKKTDLSQPVIIKAPRRFNGHKGLVSKAVITPDGNRMISGGRDGFVRLWDVNTGAEVRHWEFLGRVTDLALLPNGTSALIVTDSRLFRLELDGDAKPTGLDPVSGILDHLSVSPDGTRVVTGSNEGTVRLWNVATGKVKHEWRPGAEGDPVYAVAFSPDGKRIATGGDSRVLDLWDGETGKRIGRVVKPEGITAVAFTPNSRRVLSGHWDGIVRIHDANRSLEIGALGVGSREGITMSVSPNGRHILLIWGRNPANGGLWDLASGRCLARLEGLASFAGFTCNFSPDGRHALTCGEDGAVRMWPLPDPPPERVGELLRFKGHKGFAPRALFTADGKRVISCGHDGTVRLWDVRTTQELRQWKFPSQVNDLALMPDRQSVLASTDSRLFHWAIDAKEPPRGLEEVVGRLTAVAVSPDGSLALAGSMEGDIRLWDVRSGKLKRERRPGAEGEDVCGVAFSPDGKRYATGGESQLLDSWDTATGNRIHRVVKPQPISRVAFTPDGKWLLSGHWDGIARFHDVAAGHEIGAIGVGPRIGTTIIMSPEGRRVLLCWGKCGGLWDLKTRQQLLRLEGEGDFAAHAGDISADGTHILTCGLDGTVHLFRLPGWLE